MWVQQWVGKGQRTGIKSKIITCQGSNISLLIMCKELSKDAARPPTVSDYPLAGMKRQSGPKFNALRSELQAVDDEGLQPATILQTVTSPRTHLARVAIPPSPEPLPLGSDPMVDQAIIVLIGTKRMFGRCTASAIASASR